MSLESLRKLAERNLCETCYKTYLELLEPSVKNFLSKPLSDWRDVEEWVTLLVMKLEGVLARALREARNKIHDPLSEFTHQDLTLFSRASTIMGQIFHITLFNLEDVMSKNRKLNVENLAKRWLLKNQE